MNSPSNGPRRGPRRGAGSHGGGSDRGGRGRPGDREGRGRSARSDRPVKPRKKTTRSGGKIPPPPVIRDDVRVERVSDGAKAKTRRPRASTTNKRSRYARIDVTEVSMGTSSTATEQKLQRRLAEAAVAFEAERFSEAEKLLVSIQRIAPDVAEVSELLGLTYYRLGRWVKAIREFERFYASTGSVEQHPVWADCNRALRRWDAAEKLWFELGDTSPSPALTEEGRIVQAGALADRGRIADAIRFLEKAPKPKGKPATHHLRRWYVVADLYERAGDNARARRLFADITNTEPAFGDAAERAASLA